MGADDYVTKPLELRELVVRVKTAVAHRLAHAPRRKMPVKTALYVFRLLPADVMNHGTARNGEAIKLTRAGTSFTAGLCDQPGSAASRTRLLR